MIEDETRSLIQRFYAVLWNAWDDEAVAGVLAEDLVFRGSLGAQTRGRRAWREYRNMVRRGSPDFRIELPDLICEGDRAAARLVCTGHHLGPLLGIPASGRSFRYDAAAFFACRDGLVSEAWVLGDVEALRQQLAPQLPEDDSPGRP
jgi:steroid delta-isomerase-like uncharacterized protein